MCLSVGYYTVKYAKYLFLFIIKWYRKYILDSKTETENEINSKRAPDITATPASNLRKSFANKSAATQHGYHAK